MMPMKSWSAEFVIAKIILELRGNLQDWKLTCKGKGGKLIHGVAETKSRKKERQSKRGCLVLFSTIFNRY
jgi:hypothetical protein